MPTLIESLASAVSKAKLLRLCRSMGYHDLTGKTKSQLLALLRRKRTTARSKSQRKTKIKMKKKKSTKKPTKHHRKVRGIPSSAFVKRKQLLEYITEHLSGVIELKKAKHYKLMRLRRLIMASNPMAVFTPLYQRALALDPQHPEPTLIALISQLNRRRKEQNKRPVRARRTRESPGQYYYYLLRQEAKLNSSSTPVVIESPSASPSSSSPSAVVVASPSLLVFH